MSICATIYYLLYLYYIIYYMFHIFNIYICDLYIIYILLILIFYTCDIIIFNMYIICSGLTYYTIYTFKITK